MTSNRKNAWVILLLLLGGRESDGWTPSFYFRPFTFQERTLLAVVLCMTSPDDNDVIDAVLVQDSDSSSIQTQIPGKARRRKLDMFNDAVQRLAQLSLEDYKWRSGIFKSQEADRLVEVSVARMRGEEPLYVRPMDATDSKIGPLVRGTTGTRMFIRLCLNHIRPLNLLHIFRMT